MVCALNSAGDVIMVVGKHDACHHEFRMSRIELFFCFQLNDRAKICKHSTYVGLMVAWEVLSLTVYG